MENLNAEQVTNPNNELYDYVKRIVAAVKYKGECDHEDVPSILKKFAEGYEQKIKELTEERKKWEKAYDCADSARRELSSECDRLTEENERLRGTLSKSFNDKTEEIDGNTTGTYDGIMYIFSGDKGKELCVTASGDENDRFVSLNDCLAEIGCGADDTALVIIEDYTKGYVYRYNNYGDKRWYRCGETEGFA